MRSPLAKASLFAGLTVAVGVLASVLPRLMVSSSTVNMKLADLPGGSERPGREGTSDIVAVDHLIVQAIDPSTGQAVGRRTHEPLTVVKFIDKATPGLHKAWANARLFPSLTLDWYRIDLTGQETGYYKVTLTNAIVVAVETFMPTAFLPRNASFGHMEKVSFVYEAIEWNWLPDGRIEQDIARPPTPGSGDFNRDRAVDLRDIAELQRCLPTLSHRWIVCATAFDLNADETIDQRDIAAFVPNITGPPQSRRRGKDRP